MDFEGRAALGARVLASSRGEGGDIHTCSYVRAHLRFAMLAYVVVDRVAFVTYPVTIVPWFRAFLLLSLFHRSRCGSHHAIATLCHQVKEANGLNARNGRDRTALMLAASVGHIDMLRALLDARAGPCVLIDGAGLEPSIVKGWGTFGPSIVGRVSGCATE